VPRAFFGEGDVAIPSSDVADDGVDSVMDGLRITCAMGCTA
jgi:hypothetical protein